MVAPKEYSSVYFPIKYFLNSYRALSDGRTGITHLQSHLNSADFLLSDWKVIWIGTCTILRTSIDLFRLDQRVCVSDDIKEEIKKEWKDINKNRDEHSIFWEFLRKERNNIVHEYNWSAYDALYDKDGNQIPRLSLLSVKEENMKYMVLMKSGMYEGKNSIDLLNEGAQWVEERIFSAIRRAGFDPDERRNPVTFEPPPKIDFGNSLLGGE